MISQSLEIEVELSLGVARNSTICEDRSIVNGLGSSFYWDLNRTGLSLLDMRYIASRASRSRYGCRKRLGYTGKG